VPLLLVLVGVAGFVGNHVDPDQLNHSVGISGGLGDQIRRAFQQSGRGPWVITAVGLLGLVSTGRSLSRVLLAASSNAWRLPIERKASARIVGAVAGLVCGVYERYGSVSTLFFSLPVVRIVPRRSARVRRFFDLDR
jgi:uncharacterized BrkB/YihY/UPF0761 family membrane protein